VTCIEQIHRVPLHLRLRHWSQENHLPQLHQMVGVCSKLNPYEAFQMV
jgi:hypothetical protein